MMMVMMAAANIVIAIDSTDIKVTNRGQWLREISGI
jgi:hypothetical protein